MNQSYCCLGAEIAKTCMCHVEQYTVNIIVLVLMYACHNRLNASTCVSCFCSFCMWSTANENRTAIPCIALSFTYQILL